MGGWVGAHARHGQRRICFSIFRVQKDECYLPFSLLLLLPSCALLPVYCTQMTTTVRLSTCVLLHVFCQADSSGSFPRASGRIMQRRRLVRVRRGLHGPEFSATSSPGAPSPRGLAAVAGQADPSSPATFGPDTLEHVAATGLAAPVSLFGGQTLLVVTNILLLEAVVSFGEVGYYPSGFAI